jgi:uncharacterized membrane protein YqjE
MDEDDEQPAVAAGEAARHRHLEDDLRGLVDRGMAFARAEVDLQKARGAYAAGRLKWIALLGGLALVLLFFSLVALTVGLLIALTPMLGSLGATLAVFGGLVIVALICALIVAQQWKAMIRTLSNRDAE